jgi:hypothetical protein
VAVADRFHLVVVQADISHRQDLQSRLEYR